MPGDKYAIEQTIRSFFSSINLPHAEIIISRFEELENFDFVEFSFKHYALRAIVFLQGQYHDQPGYLFLDSVSILMLVNNKIFETLEEHKSDYPHSIGL